MPNSGCFMAQKTHSSKKHREKRERQFDMEIIQLFYCPCVTIPYYIYKYTSRLNQQVRYYHHYIQRSNDIYGNPQTLQYPSKIFHSHEIVYISLLLSCLM